MIVRKQRYGFNNNQQRSEGKHNKQHNEGKKQRNEQHNEAKKQDEAKNQNGEKKRDHFINKQQDVNKQRVNNGQQNEANKGFYVRNRGNEQKGVRDPEYEARRRRQEEEKNKLRQEMTNSGEKNMFHITLFETFLSNYTVFWRSQNKFSFLLQDDDPESKYREMRTAGNKSTFRKTVHQGQRKLLLSELYFFIHTRPLWENHEHVIVVYIGSAEGSHLMILWDLLMGYDPKKFEWHLYDSNPFDKRVKETAIKYPHMVTIFNEYFTEETVKRYEGKTTILISDIRDTSVGAFIKEAERDPDNLEKIYEANIKVEEAVYRDNELNKNIYLMLKPLCASIKFRLPYIYNENSPKTSEFLSGEVLLQAWAPVNSTETRLIVKSPEIITWDNVKYEKQLAHHNQTTRRYLFYMRDKLYEPYCPCWDCTYEAGVLALFYRTFYPTLSVDNIYEDESRTIDWVLKKKLYDVRFR